MRKLLLAASLFLGLYSCSSNRHIENGGNNSSVTMKNEDRIQPWSENPRYWQYKGKPVLLLGGSKTDHIFLADGLMEHLDEIQRVGGNYVRNTMSQEEGRNLNPYKLLPDGKFDLGQWNDDYWTRFANMLKWTAERRIFVQIEVWDRFNYRAQNWEASPWNPGNNINYDSLQSGFAREYTDQQLYTDVHPFFHTIPGTQHYNNHYDLVRKYQEAFVDKMLSYSLPYGHVLYCMDNETSSDARWGQYWIEFIQARAADQGVIVCTTDMFDDLFEAEKSRQAPFIFNDPKHYTFADISQVNSRSYDEAHWNKMRWLVEQIDKYPRPINHIKIYGSGYYVFGTGGPEDGIERFWRDVLGGAAGVRFHRPDAGNGLKDLAKASIRAARLLESQIKLWDITPHMELLFGCAPNEVYLAATPGERYALYFTNGGSVELDMTRASGAYNVTWISISTGRTVETSEQGGFRLMDKSIKGGRVVTITAPYKGGWVAAIVKRIE